MGERPGGIFEIFQNGHIFLKFLFLKNIKKKKPRARISSLGSFTFGPFGTEADGMGRPGGWDGGTQTQEARATLPDSSS